MRPDASATITEADSEIQGYVRDTGLCRFRHKPVYPAHQIMPRASLPTAFYTRIITCSRLSYAP
jgi:hypothetical protein